MQKFRCRRCRKIHTKDELVGKRNIGGWSDNCCPNCGCKEFTLVFTLVEEERKIRGTNQCIYTKSDK